MTSAQMHPLFAAFAAAGNSNVLGTSSSSTSNGLTISSAAAPSSGNNQSNSANNNLTSSHHSPTGMGLGLGSSLSVTITPTTNTTSSPPAAPPPHKSTSLSPSVAQTNANAAAAAFAMALSNAQNGHSQNRMDEDGPPSPLESPAHSPGCTPSRSPSPSHDFKDVKDILKPPMSLPNQLAMGMSLNPSTFTSGSFTAQQQQLRALATTLQSAIAAAAQAQQQQNNTNIMGKMMELAGVNGGMDEMAMTELTQRLIKMNQEIWQQGLASVAAAASSQQQSASTSTPPPPPPPPPPVQFSSNSGGPSLPPNSSQMHSPIISNPSNNSAAAAAVAALNALTSGQQQQQQQVNEIKLAEKLVNELAVQIFMHKSAMQLQQQQAVAAQQQGGSGHHMGSHGPLMRGGSSSGSESGNGIAKAHQCQQCLKSFSSNHQLVQHIRVHTGEKPYKCSYCDRRFKQLSHVQQHTRLHTGERPYKCHVTECGRAFIQLSNLQQHLRNHDAQIERSKNRPFHCNICGKGFATESSLRTHTSKVCKEHGALIGGSNTLSCPVCHKLFLGGEALMEHMKYTHKDPNASGVATKRRTANHPCPICGKHYVNEGSLRKHLSCHPETAQLSSSLRVFPCQVCQAVFTHENGYLTHMEQMRMDPKHQFHAQYTLSRAAVERRERENILAAAAISAMAQAGGHPFGGNHQGQGIQHGSLGQLLPLMPPSPSGSESSGRLSSPLDTNSGMSHSGLAQHSRLSMSSPISNNGPLELTRIHPNGNNNNNTESRTKEYNPSGMSGHNSSGGENNLGSRDDQPHHHHSSHQGHLPFSSGHHNILGENGMLQSNSKHLQDAMKMAAMLGQGSQNDLRNLIHQQDMMTENVRMQAENMLRNQAAEALRLAVENHNSSNNNNNSKGNNGNSSTGTSPILGSTNGPINSETMVNNHMNAMISQHQHPQSGHHSSSGMANGHRSMMDHRMEGGQGIMDNRASHHHLHHPSLNHHSHHQLNSILSQQPDLSEALMRLDARSLGFPLSAHNS